MKTICKKIISALLAALMLISGTALFPLQSACAAELIGNGLVLSTDSVTVTKDSSVTFTAALGEGYDASRLTCVIADANVAVISPVAYAGNVAAFQIDYRGNGQTVAAVFHADNPSVIAYLPVSATPILMEIPAVLGTNHDNYCVLTGYEFVPYDFTYTNFNDYQSTLNLKYQCTAYGDNDYSKWGCYGYFYDADDNIISKVHLYCSVLSKGRTYHSEFHVPVNAVRFSIEGF